MLLYHIVEGNATSSFLTDGLLTTLSNGATVAITKTSSGDIMVNDANVIFADFPASNGLIHAIDAVLLPPADTAPFAEDDAYSVDATTDYTVLLDLIANDIDPDGNGLQVTKVKDSDGVETMRENDVPIVLPSGASLIFSEGLQEALYAGRDVVTSEGLGFGVDYVDKFEYEVTDPVSGLVSALGTVEITLSTPALSNEDLCTTTGGTVDVTSCCGTASDFPNLCGDANICPCPPGGNASNKTVCSCPEGSCFHDIAGCVTDETASKAQLCEDSGGTVASVQCCVETEDLSDTCGIVGPCGCPPSDSEQRLVCDCAESSCFSGTAGCVAETAAPTGAVDEPTQGPTDVADEPTPAPAPTPTVPTPTSMPAAEPPTDPIAANEWTAVGSTKNKIRRNPGPTGRQGISVFSGVVYSGADIRNLFNPEGPYKGMYSLQALLTERVKHISCLVLFLSNIPSQLYFLIAQIAIKHTPVHLRIWLSLVQPKALKQKFLRIEQRHASGHWFKKLKLQKGPM